MQINRISFKQHLKAPGRSFGLTLAIVLLALAMCNHQPNNRYYNLLAAFAVLLIIASLLKPVILLPLQKGWTTLGYYLTIVNTLVILSVFFFLILTPIGLLMRLIGIDLIDRRIKTPDDSYWKIPVDEQTNLKNQF